MKDQLANKALGVTERRVPTLIRQRKLKAYEVGRDWHIEDLELCSALHRPLYEHSRLILSRAQHRRRLAGLRDQDRKRTAKRIAELHASDNPAAMLIDRWEAHNRAHWI